MCRKKIDSTSCFFKHPAVILTGVILFVCTLLFSAAFSAQDTAESLRFSTNSNSLAAYPGNEQNSEAAVRWNSRCRNGIPVRLGNNRSLQHTPVIHPDSLFLTSQNPELVIRKNFITYSKETEFTYYRRLWQKILPTRAGPSA